MAGKLWTFLSNRSNDIAAFLLVTMFVSFLIQVVLRYVFNWPVGWTFELQTVTWLWLILWGSALVLSPADEIRFDILYSSVPEKPRRVMRVISSLGLIVLYAVSFPAAVDFVTFMKIEKSSYLDIRFDFLFSIYLIFAVASIIRYAVIAWLAFRELPEPGEIYDAAANK
jgi:TRAP-type C4-dicarboxylate transport system permease small subunit